MRTTHDIKYCMTDGIPNERLKAINADTLKESVSEMPLAGWLKDQITEAIDSQPAINEQAEVIYQSLIPLNPKTKKNNQKIIYNTKTKHSMIVQSNAYKEYEQAAGWFLKRPPCPISEPVNIKCVFYRDSERRCDLTNLLEAIDDILVKYKIIADDNFKIIYSHDGSRVFVDRGNPRTEIEITKIINYTT